MSGDELPVQHRPGLGQDLGPAQLVLAGGVGHRLAAVQQPPPAQQDGPGAQGGQPDVPPGGLLNEGGHPVVVPQVLHAGAAAGENQHLRLIQIHFIHRQIGLDRNVVGPGNSVSGQGD